jgi:FkbH-like protein
LSEPVKLVIWDLDDTFWQGTIVDDGRIGYVRAHHDIVIELARRGIISSICSRSDSATALGILRKQKIADFFAFPSISWSAKGPRLAELIHEMKLRPQNVLFIDDHHGNRAEALLAVPGIQVADETFPRTMLDDPRLAGQADPGLTRLKHYKLLELRQADRSISGASNVDFLRGSDIRVRIDYDVLAHLDRAVELINRTNQLNFTKLRLPEDREEAREVLRREVDNRSRQSGLIHLSDKYGDYGFVGFFMLENGVLDAERRQLSQSLLHFCFSCRVLGMFVESWLYDRLQRPRIKVAPPVLIDLSKRPRVDWIRMAEAGDGPVAQDRLAPEIRIHGGCEAASVAHYLGHATDRLTVTGNFHAGASFFRLNGAGLLLSACDRNGAHFDDEARGLHAPPELLSSRYFSDAPEGTAFVFGGQHDAPGPRRYRHKVWGWEFWAEINGFPAVDLTTIGDEDVERHIEAAGLLPEYAEMARATRRHIRSRYVSVPGPDDATIVAQMEEIFRRIPDGSRLVLMLDDERVRDEAGTLHHAGWVRHYNMLIESMLLPPFVGIARFADAIEAEEEILFGGNHYDRMVYLRMSGQVADCLGGLPAKGDPAATVRRWVARGVAPLHLAVPGTPVTIIEREGLRVDYYSAPTPRGVVAIGFSQRLHGELAAQELAGLGFGTPKLLELGFDVVAVKTDRTAWYANLTDKDLARINAALGSVADRHAARVGYGSSMGAYAAIRFSKALGLSRVLALSPVFDITDPRDKRWKDDIVTMQEARGETKRGPQPMMSADYLSRDCSYFFAYDPYDQDRMHVARYRLLIGSRLEELKAPFAGHPVGFFLLQLGHLEAVVDQVLGHGWWPNFGTRWRRAKAHSPDYLFWLTNACIARGHFRWAASLSPRVVALRGDRADSHAQACLIAMRRNDIDHARAAIDRAIELDPGNVHFAGLARSVMTMQNVVAMQRQMVAG